MDILHLVDRLEELFNESRPIPLTHSVVVDENRVLEIIDQMRISIPDEVKKAQQVLAQRDRVLAKGEEEAERTIKLAQEKAEELTATHPIAQAAQELAEQILADAEADAEAIRQESDDYAAAALELLEEELNELLNQTRKRILDHTSEPQQEQESTEAEKSREPEEPEPPESHQD